MTTPKTEAPKPFNLSSIVAVDVVQLDIKNPATQQPVGWTWEIAGPTHQKTIAQRNQQAREAASESRMQRQQRLNGKTVVLPEDDIEANRIKNANFWMERVLGWSPVSLDGKEDYPYSKENGVKLLLDEKYGWLYLQLLEFLGEDARFLKISAKN